MAFLFTTFPVATETFLQREQRGLAVHGLEPELWSLWGGADNWEGRPVRRFQRWRFVVLIPWILYWLARRPSAFLDVMEDMALATSPHALSILENGAGLAFAILYARHFERREIGHFHAVWGSMPATAALLLSRLLKVPYSMGAHAYDIFEGGGDWNLEGKLRHASFVQTSSDASGRVLRERLGGTGKVPGKVHVIYRGLSQIPELERRGESPGKPLRLLGIGRLVEKMGFERFLAILRDLEERGVDWEARLAGDGPERERLAWLAKRGGLEQRLQFCGIIPERQVWAELAWADIFLFTGVVARSGDRAGIPNAVLEAMAAGVPVVASPVGGVEEVVRDGETGLIARTAAEFAKGVLRLRGDPSLYASIRERAHAHVREHHDAGRNAGQLVALLEGAARDGCSK